MTKHIYNDLGDGYGTIEIHEDKYLFDVLSIIFAEDKIKSDVYTIDDLQIINKNIVDKSIKGVKRYNMDGYAYYQNGEIDLDDNIYYPKVSAEVMKKFNELFEGDFMNIDDLRAETPHHRLILI